MKKIPTTRKVERGVGSPVLNSHDFGKILQAETSEGRAANVSVRVPRTSAEGIRRY
jgi:hypothetical protein